MLEIILVQGFCPVKIEVTQFPIGFHLTPVIVFVHFLLAAGEWVLAAGELVVCQVFSFFCCFLAFMNLLPTFTVFYRMMTMKEFRFQMKWPTGCPYFMLIPLLS